MSFLGTVLTLSMQTVPICVPNEYQSDESNFTNSKICGNCNRDEGPCSSSEYEFWNGSCIPIDWYCDGWIDETNCSWQCANGNCVVAYWCCDGWRNYSNNEDEVNCANASSEYTSEQLKCDGCPKNENETDCTAVANTDSGWRCDDGYVADDCDEMNLTCGEYVFQCGCGCIFGWTCDARADGSDGWNCNISFVESECPQCIPLGWKCVEQSCMRERKECYVLMGWESSNGDYIGGDCVDCRDDCDGFECDLATQFDFGEDHLLIIEEQVCDGWNDCEDAGAEVDCDVRMLVGYWEFVSKDAKCAHGSHECEGKTEDGLRVARAILDVFASHGQRQVHNGGNFNGKTQGSVMVI